MIKEENETFGTFESVSEFKEDGEYIRQKDSTFSILRPSSVDNTS